MRSEINNCITQISRVIRGKEKTIELSLVCLLANGHLLLEDLPGMGKTTLSQALAQVLGLDFARVQFTSDLLPADLLGVNIFETSQHNFRFHPGPIFNQLVLADEINRASPKTQSALLEAMAERQVSIDGITRKLPSPFFVIASQNPLYQSGTHPLPESQLDRFNMQLSIGYPNFDAEKEMLQNTSGEVVLNSILSIEQFIELQQQVKQVKVSDAVTNYILNLVRLSRESADFPNAISPRGAKSIYRTSQAAAFVKKRDFVVPEDVQYVFSAVCEHRLRGQLSSQTSTTYSEHLLQHVDPLVA